MPLLPLLKPTFDDQPSLVKHAAYADDLTGACSIHNLKQWLENVEQYGPLLGYFPKATKSWLIFIEDQFNIAVEALSGTNINFTKSGRNNSGSFVRTSAAKDDCVKTLSQIARSKPKVAYAGFVSGLKHKIS